MATNLEKLLETNKAEQLATLKTVAPSGWERGQERVGDRGRGSTGPMEPGENADQRTLLERAGFDPDEWSIVGDIHYREWDANVGGGVIKTMQYRKFDVRRNERTEHGFEELMERVKARSFTPTPGVGAGTFNMANGDWQLGKIDGDGTKGTVDRILQSTERAVAQFKQLRKGRTAFVHLPFMGDCGEGFVSQGGKNIWRTELTQTEQNQLTRRLMDHIITEFAPLAERVTATSVPGNHDEAIREPGMTTYDDSFAVDSLVAVTDAMLKNPAAYGHVETFVPRRDELTVTMDVNGTIICHAHGHQWRPGKHWDWWQGQSFEPGADIGKATILLSAHGHHFSLDTKGQRQYIMSPAQESMSRWWQNRTGDHGAPGALTFVTEAGRANLYSVL